MIGEIIYGVVNETLRCCYKEKIARNASTIFNHVSPRSKNQIKFATNRILSRRKERKKISILTLLSKYSLRADAASRIHSDVATRVPVVRDASSRRVLGQRRKRPVGIVLAGRITKAVRVREHRVRVGHAVLASMPSSRRFRGSAVFRGPTSAGQLLPAHARLIREAHPLRAAPASVLHRLSPDQATPFEYRRRRRRVSNCFPLDVVGRLLLVDRGGKLELPRLRNVSPVKVR